MQKLDQLVAIEHVRVLDPEHSVDEVADVVVQGSLITCIGPGAARTLPSSTPERSAQSVRRIDGRGRLLLPGFIDLSAHLGEPGEEYKETLESALSAAAAGGYVRLCAEPDTDPVNDNRVVTQWLVQKAAEIGGPTLHPIAAATEGLAGRALSEMAALQRAGAVAVGDGKRGVQSGGLLRRVLEYARDLNLPVFQHPRDTSLTEGTEMNEGLWSTRLGLRGSPAVAEESILARDLALAHYVGSRYHASTVSTAAACELLLRAREQRTPATASVPIQHLALTEEALATYDTNLKLDPPLRTERDRQALLASLENGTLDAVVSDHRPQSALEKNREFAAAEPGAIGLQLTFSVLLGLIQRGELSLAAALRALSSGPAGVLGLPAPRLQPGAIADLVLVDAEATWRPDSGNWLSLSQNSPWFGEQLSGRVLLTLAKGAIAFEADDLLQTEDRLPQDQILTAPSDRKPQHP